jgi:transcriptional antiterminator Rof (Rho-off)
MHWNESPDVNHKLTVVPTDLYTQGGREFLKIRDDQGQTRVIRLDRILDFSPVD